MFKLRSMMEDVAEKLFGRFLPQVEAKAHTCFWETTPMCCNPPYSTDQLQRRKCCDDDGHDCYYTGATQCTPAPTCAV